MNESDLHVLARLRATLVATANTVGRMQAARRGRPGFLARAGTSLVVVVAGACSAATLPSASAPLAGITEAASPASTPRASDHPTPTPAPSATLAQGAPQVVPQGSGTFEGHLASATETFPVLFWIDGCGHPDEICGTIKYADPKHPDFDRCAPLLLLLGQDGDADVFDQVPAYRPDACPRVPLRMARTGTDPLTIEVTPYGDVAAAACCRGTMVQTSDTPPGADQAPRLSAIDGLAGPLTTSDLIGPVTPFSAADAGHAYFPAQGEVISVDLTTGESEELAYNRDYASIVDPASVAAVGDAIWEGRGPSKMLVRVDDSGTGSSIPLSHPPYALAADGTTLWVTSLDDGVVMAVDTETGQVRTTIDLSSPTGVAVGGGSVWVLEARGNRLARIDPASAKVTAEVALGDADPDPACGMCAESVIYAFGSAWTANNFGRSITRVDGRTLKGTTIPTANRVWSVAAYGNEIYGSQFEEVDGYIDRSVGGLVRIDPETGKVAPLSAPGVLGVAALADRLWLIVPGRSSDLALTYRRTP